MVSVVPNQDHARDGNEEVRLALVLNGGVSLAVWIGGVTHEIDRLRRAGYSHDADVGDWQGLVDALKVRVNVDVISGASAGGLNGAVLAASIARSQKLPVLRDVWLEVADVSDQQTPSEAETASGHERLLTRAHDWSTPSVLDGEFFLRRIHDVFADDGQDSRDAPTVVTLYLTGTMLNGIVGAYEDESGVPFYHGDYRVRFRFHHQDTLVQADGSTRRSHSDFATAPRGDRQDADARLARAARATASFPGAFVPVYCRVGEGSIGPDMDAVSNLTSGRWVMDGGVLDNEPFGPVFEEIRHRPLDGPVDRVLAYVVPYRGGTEDRTGGGADSQDVVPGPITVLPKVFNLPREVGIVDDLTTLKGLLSSVEVDETAQRDILMLTIDPKRKSSVKAYAGASLPAYRRRRLLGGVWQAREILADTSGERVVSLAPMPPLSDSESEPEMDVAPWVPDSIAADPAGSWSWGLSVAESFVRTWLSIIRDVLPTNANVRVAAERISRQLPRLDAITKRLESELRSVVANAPDQPNDVILAGAIHAFKTATGPVDRANGAARAPWLRQIVDETAAAVVRVAGELGDARSALPAGTTARGLIDRHLESEVVLRAYQPPSLQSTVPRFRFHRVSPDPVSPLDVDEHPREGTIMGLGLNHFGGFLKREWRANDWMWGRLHGAHHLVHILVTPNRLRTLKKIGDLRTALTAIRALLGACDPGVADSLTRLGESDGEIDNADVEAVRAALVYRLQAGVVQEELPFLAAAAVDPDSSPDTWPAWVRALYPSGKRPGDREDDAERALAAFRACRIAETDSVTAFGRTREGKGDELAAFLAALRAVRADSKLPGRLHRPISVVEFDFDHALTRHVTEDTAHTVERILSHLPKF
jgi:predicted acylesterase/phospholipase RssA